MGGVRGSIKTPMHEPCASCSTPCCSRFAVPLTAFDVARIIAKTKKKAEEFVELAPFEGIEASTHSAIFFFKNGRLGEKTLILKRRKVGGAKFCAFWKAGSGCSVWGSHPIACRIYPFAIDEKNTLAYARHFVCPRKWKENEYDAAEVRRNMQKQDEEVEAHNKIIRKWNATMARKKGSGESAFLNFLLKEAKEKR
jgi:Fe-S-cluster containining protein